MGFKITADIVSSLHVMEAENNFYRHSYVCTSVSMIDTPQGVQFLQHAARHIFQRLPHSQIS